MLYTKFLEIIKHLRPCPPLTFLILATLFLLAPCGCLLDYDLEKKVTNDTTGDFDPFDTQNDGNDDDTTATSADDNDDDTDIVYKDTDSLIPVKDSDTQVTPEDTDSETDTETTADSEVNPPNLDAIFSQEAEETEVVFLECGSGGTIAKINFASFGQYVGSCAGGPVGIGKCHFEGTSGVIESLCLGKSSCQLLADKKEVFDDSCKKDDHFLIVKYTCHYKNPCPPFTLKSVPGKCGCDVPDYDSDGDGSADCNDECDDDPTKKIAGPCGCDAEEEDHDKDGVPSCIDQCDDDENKIEPGICGCGKKDDDLDDRDGDGTIDCRDKCPDDPLKIDKGLCGCNKTDDPTDTDRDGTPDCRDKCPNDPNKKDPGDCGCGRRDTFLCMF